jgi:hypothetical protein
LTLRRGTGTSAATAGSTDTKADLSLDPDSELNDEVTATTANVPDRDGVAGLLAGHAGEQDKPEVVGEAAYGDAAIRASLEEQGYCHREMPARARPSPTARPRPPS